METIKTLVNILTNNFKVKSNINENMYDCPLTGPSFELDATELYQFLMCIENEFGISIFPEDIQKYGFRTLEDISHIISKKFL